MVHESLKQLVSNGEFAADMVCRKTKLVLPFVARLCLLSSFIHLDIALIRYWDVQAERLASGKDLHWVFIAAICFTASTSGSVMILLQRRVSLACGLLLLSLFLQMFGLYSNMNFILMDAGVLGSLFILLAESKQETRTLFATVPTLDYTNPKDYLKLSGRILIVIMYVNCMSFEPSIPIILQNIIGSVLLFSVILGYKTQLSVITMTLFFNFSNLQMYVPKRLANLTEEENDKYEYYKNYRFFQSISVTGGLLMIVLYGPGNISLDKAGKQL